MTIRAVWRSHAGPSPLPHAVLDALGASGIATYEIDGDAAAGGGGAGEGGGPGLVFFASGTPGLFELVRRASRAGRERVLAIGVGDDAVPAAVAWRLLRAGASDVLGWHAHERPAAAIAARLARWAEVDRLVDAPLVRDHLVGRSAPWLAALRHVVEVARFTDASVLVLGETGTGKELVARLVHSLDARARKGELVVLDCATVVPELSGSEFFGHERGAFTGALAARDGCFAMANGGTLFLDEIGELPLPLQAELLRAIQERTYKRVGGNAWRRSAFRLVCASNRDLFGEASRGAFRADLYYRVASVVVQLPPLRERLDDVPALAAAFLAESDPTRDPPALDAAVREWLLARDYPGNVRDLRQLVQRIAARHVGPGPITVGDIPPDERPTDAGASVDWRDAAFENAIRRAVARGVGLREIGHAATEVAVDVAVDVEGSLQRAARQLGVTDRALQLRRAARRGKPGLGAALAPPGPDWASGPPLPA